MAVAPELWIDGRPAGVEDLGRQAEQEGHTGAPAALRQSLSVESRHPGLYRHLLEQAPVERPQAYYVCQICGLVHPNDAPERCPVCGALPEKFNRVD